MKFQIGKKYTYGKTEEARERCYSAMNKLKSFGYDVEYGVTEYDNYYFRIIGKAVKREV